MKDTVETLKRLNNVKKCDDEFINKIEKLIVNTPTSDLRIEYLELKKLKSQMLVDCMEIIDHYRK